MTRRRGITNKPPPSPPLLSDESTPSPPPRRHRHHRHHCESQTFTQNFDLSPDSHLVNENEIDYETDDGDEGLGNNCEIYMSYPKKALPPSLHPKDQNPIQKRKFEALKDFMDACGMEFTGVELYEYVPPSNQLKASAAAEEFEKDFFAAMLDLVGLDGIKVLDMDTIKTLCKQLTKWMRAKRMENGIVTDEEIEEHKDLAQRFEDGSRSFIKREYKENGRTAFDDATHRGKNNQIKMSVIKNTFLPKILLEMSLISAKNDERGSKILFLTEDEKIRITGSDWPAANTFNNIFNEDEDKLWQDVLREREEDSKCEEFNVLQTQLKALRVENARYKKDISRLKNDIDSLRAQNGELHQALEDSDRKILELSKEKQNLSNEAQRLRQLEGLEGEAKTSNNMHMPKHGGVQINIISTPVRTAPGTRVDIYPTPAVLKNEED